MTDESACDKNCIGDPTFKCGGGSDGKINIYSVEVDGNLLACVTQHMVKSILSKDPICGDQMAAAVRISHSKMEVGDLASATQMPMKTAQVHVALPPAFVEVAIHIANVREAMTSVVV